jgi:hypothetical protein
MNIKGIIIEVLERGDIVAEEEAEKKTQEETIKLFIAAYIDAYMDSVEEMNVKEADFPLFYTNYPFKVIGYILPDNSLCVLFKGLASAMTIEVEKSDFKYVDSEISQKKFHHICCYSPSQSYTKEMAKKHAISDVTRDIENARMLSAEDVDTVSRAELLRTIALLSVAMPWITARGTKAGTLRAPPKSDLSKFAVENLRKSRDEDSQTYTQRLGNLESMLLGVPPEMPKKEIPPPAPPPVPLPLKTPPGAPSGTNISIEIKQPEGKTKEELFDDKTDLDILRLKKTLLLQTTDIEELRRKVYELSNKIANYEQMRQTVFRMNRKVYDNDARMGNVEKSNREVMKKMAEAKAEQKEENKKVRRFIIEKSKKARNQALVVGLIALVFGVTAVLIAEWDTVKSVLGI